MSAVKYVVQSNQVLANGQPVFSGTFAECGAYVVAALNGGSDLEVIDGSLYQIDESGARMRKVTAPVEAPTRTGLDMSRGRLYSRGNGLWCAWHPDWNHPVHGHKLLVGTESACRRVLGLAPSAESKALAAAAVSEIRATLDDEFSAA